MVVGILFIMLEPEFVLPDPKTSQIETQKRLALIAWFTEYIRESIVGFLVTGSMAYGQNYSVKPGSDIDMQLLLTPERADSLLQTDCFNYDELHSAIDGYRRGLYGQFSLVFKKDDVVMECHFWDSKQFIQAITFASQNTKRLRSTIESPSTDYGYSFDRAENIFDYYGEMIDGFAVADFHSYRVVDGKMYLCRPITNILGAPLVQIGSSQLDEAMNLCWRTTVKHLSELTGSSAVDLGRLNVVNTLPGKNKLSPAALDQIQTKTAEMLKLL
jgi:hypothetical protein